MTAIEYQRNIRRCRSSPNHSRSWSELLRPTFRRLLHSEVTVHYKSAPQEIFLGNSRPSRKGTPAPAGGSSASAGGFAAKAGNPEVSSLCSPYTSREIFLGKSAVLLRDFRQRRCRTCLPRRLEHGAPGGAGSHRPAGAGGLQGQYVLMSVESSISLVVIRLFTYVDTRTYEKKKRINEKARGIKVSDDEPWVPGWNKRT
ncbi:hypothetical protein CC1G_14765 [Coprinopsis cinerea okayama7|uniref:Uncharacterized protein n=1 Tax=Coprinopsis cinerea (strain Okayama-7 / 130 / ATCC MYA-4618 / FGSC 9003) TaxID=240176 RepID=D6RNM8_COPC7|nr:hypothetical protein CC1G_14765 [Coprinopsis cinerea okayama7\|eukprot:XP_002910787.1 hypothetical protein CC1G_14765 [Coprinopsis cinerea okayama7\